MIDFVTYSPLTAMAERDEHIATSLTDSEDYDRFSRGQAIADPYPLLHRLRTEDPVHWCEPMQSWVLTRYNDIVECYKDTQTFRNDRSTLNVQPFDEEAKTRYAPLREHISNWMGFTEGEKHDRMRGLVTRAFSTRIIRQLQPMIESIVDDLLDSVKGKDRFDFVHDIAFLLPATVICNLLGIEQDNHEEFRQWTQPIANFTGGVSDRLIQIAEQARISYEHFQCYFRELIEKRRRAPRDDLISQLVNNDVDLTETELIGMCVFLFVAGYDTTLSMLTTGMMHLLTYRHQHEQLRRDSSLMDAMIEETLRFEPPVFWNTRLVAKDVVIRGRRIRKDQGILLHHGAANRDPDVFVKPDHFDITRSDNRHLAFGYGTHFCLGAHLARLEGKVVFTKCLEQFPAIELDTDKTTWVPNAGLRCLATLPVRI